MRFGALILLVAAFATAQDRQPACKNCAEWNIAQKPFKIYGNSYYVGTHGLGSVLIASTAGHVLIDGALPESVPQIVANIKALGFRVEDIRVIVNSHVHFDHAGGIAELQKLSGARVVASKWSADVLKKGTMARDDPQFIGSRPIAPVAKVETVRDRETLSAGAVTITAHLTPGHTPGGTSWTWQSCENSRCLNLVYADSLTPVSSDGYLFSKNKDLLDGFEESYGFLNKTPCDILITPHPSFSKLFERLEARASKPNAMVDTNACIALSTDMHDRLKARLATERGQ